MTLSPSLTPEKALIFRITHRDNVPWILDNGLWSANSGHHDPSFVAIGNEDLIVKRTSRTVPVAPGGTLSDYVPFYFTPYSPMLLNIITGRGARQRPKDEIVVLVSSLPEVANAGARFLFTDRHAYLGYVTAKHYSDRLEDLPDMVPWELLRARDFRNDPERPDKIERYQAEALVHRHLPIAALKGIAVYNDKVAATIQSKVDDRGLLTSVRSLPGWFF